MKIYISYRFSGANLTQLRKNLEYINSIIEKNWHKAYIFNRDAQNWGNINIEDNSIMKIAEKEIENSDVIFALVTSTEKSEWMMIEIWLAKAKWKKIILAMKKGTQLFLSETIADKIIRFDKIEELEELLYEKFK